MKLVLIGAGSFVFAPTVLYDAIVRHRLDGWEIALVDPDTELADLMAGLGRAMAAGEGVDVRLTASADRRAVLSGAHFVVLSAAVQGAKRWKMDFDVLWTNGMPEQARECGGLGGLIYALRSITLALGVCRDMESLCPDARLLSVTNPLPRVVTAVHRHTSVRPIGFCSVAYHAPDGYRWLAGLVGREVEQVRVTTAGINHFAWLMDIRDAATGEDLLGLVEQQIRTRSGHECEVLRRWLDAYGAVGVCGPGHMADFLPPDPDLPARTQPPFHGSSDERRQRCDALREVGAGRLNWRDAGLHFCWEHPVDVAAAIASRADATFDMVNVPNDGYLSDVPHGNIVEVPAESRAGELRPRALGPLPGRVGELCGIVSNVHELVAEAAVQGSRDLAVQAIEADPAIPDKRAATQALDQMLRAHADILPQFAQGS